MEWVLVADGAVAKILRKTERALVEVFPTYHASELVEPVDKDSRRLGRVQDSSHAGRHASYEPAEDYKDSERRKFIHEISKILDAHQKDYDRLVIVSPVKRLGEFLEHLSTPVREKVVSEISKDLVKMPLIDVYQHIYGESSHS